MLYNFKPKDGNWARISVLKSKTDFDIADLDHMKGRRDFAIICKTLIFMTKS